MLEGGPTPMLKLFPPLMRFASSTGSRAPMGRQKKREVTVTH